MEGEALAAQARGHQRQQNRRRADQRDDRNAFAMRGQDQRRAGVGHGGAARFGQQADIVPGLERRQQRRDGGGRGVFVEFLDVQRLDRLRMAHRLEVRACGFGAFDDEVVEPARDREGVRRQAGVRADRPQRHRDQVEGGHVKLHRVPCQHVDAFVQQHLGQRHQRQADQRSGVGAVHAFHQGDAERLALGRAGAVVGRFLFEIGRDLRVG